MKPRFLFLLLAIGAAGYVQAADTERKPEWKKALVLGEPSAKSQKVRKEIALGLRAEINAMLAFLPNLRLAQNQWLASEREALNRLTGEAFVSKVRKFMSSPEFALENMRSKLETDRSLSCIRAHDVSLHKEALCWARTNLLLTDRSTMNDAPTVLVENNVISLGPEVAKQLGLSESTDDRWMLFFSWGQAIQEHIVIPLLDRSE